MDVPKSIIKDLPNAYTKQLLDSILYNKRLREPEIRLVPFDDREEFRLKLLKKDVFEHMDKQQSLTLRHVVDD